MVFKNKQKRIIAGLMIGASILTIFPYFTVVFGLGFISEAVFYWLLDAFEYCGGWWWLVTFGLDVAAVVLAIRWRHQALKIISILLLIIIPIAGLTWLTLFNMLRHPPV